MGAGSFFQKYLNPIGGGPLGQIAGGKLNPLIGPVAWAGRNSFLAKESAYDPIARFLNPGAEAAGSAYLARRSPPAGYVAPPTPYAGVTPSLSAAQSAYQYQAPGAPSAQSAGAPSYPQPSSASVTASPARAWMGDQMASGGAAPLGDAYAQQQAAAVQRAQRIANPWSTALGAT